MNPLHPAALLLTALLACTTSWAAGARARDLPAVDGEVIVQFKADAVAVRRNALAVRSTPAAASVTLANRAAVLGARVGRSLQAGAAIGERSQVVRASGMSAAALAAQLAADPEVEFAVPNGRRHILAAPNDPLYAATAPGVRPSGPDSGQWYLRAPGGSVVSSINIEAAWARTSGSASVVVAVLDTGVRTDHPDLKDRLLPGYDFVTDTTYANDSDGRDADPSDPGDFVTSTEVRTPPFADCSAGNSSWHGTATLSLVGASTNDTVGMAGTAPGVRLLPVRVLGKCGGTDADIQAGMLWAAGIPVPGVPDNPNPAKVINMSLGGGGVCTASYQSVVDRLGAVGAVVVAAAGNGSGGAVGTPANCAGVVAVTALRHAGTKVGFADLGPEVTIAAPGGNCVNISPGSACLYPIIAASNSGAREPAGASWFDSYTYELGTSFSTPLVAGVLGLMYSAQPGLTPEQARNQLKATARPFPTTGGNDASVPQCRAPVSGVSQDECYCTTSTCGAGMLDAGAAVAAVAGPVAKVAVAPAAPTAGTAVTFSAAESQAGAGASLAGYQWFLRDNGGITTGFSSATNAATANITPTGAGSFTVTLTVTDSQGRTASTSQTVAVAAAPGTTPTPTPTPSGGGGGGGGAMTWPWMALLALAVACLARRQRDAGTDAT